jgi:hypothetical protein
MAGLLQGSKPTYGRSTYRPLLLPLSYRDVTPFGPQGATPIERLERYSVLGGTPQYQRWAGRRSLSAVIEDVILSPDAPLYDDPEHLIRAEDGVREPGPYFGVMEAIARGFTSPTTIGGRIGVSVQLVTNYLSRLEALGYLARVEPLEPRSAGRARAYWKISDPYFAFWFCPRLPEPQQALSRAHERGRRRDQEEAPANRLAQSSRTAVENGSQATPTSAPTRSRSDRGGPGRATPRSTSSR